MTTTRRKALGLLGATTTALTVGAAPALAGTSAGRVPPGLRPGGELDRLIADMAAEDVFSGCVLITHRGRTVLSRSHGMADKARGIPNGPGTLFGIASIAKVFAAVSVAQLAQAAKLQYLDTVGEYLDGFAPEVADHVTIHHLLTHTSGLGDPFGDPGFFEAAAKWTTVRQATEGTGAFVRAEKLAFTPGSSYTYSNSGYHVLEEIVAKVSGQEYHDYVREHIFHPAGMRSSDFLTLPQVKADRRVAHGYYRPEGSAHRVDNLDEALFGPGAYATCGDMERFAHALWEEKLLNRAFTRLVLSPNLPTVPPPGSGLTTFACYGPGATLSGSAWSYGHTGGSSAGGVGEWTFYPDSGYVTMIISNHEMDSIRGIPSLARKLIVEQG